PANCGNRQSKDEYPCHNKSEVIRIGDADAKFREEFVHGNFLQRVLRASSSTRIRTSAPRIHGQAFSEVRTKVYTSTLVFSSESMVSKMFSRTPLSCARKKRP